MSFSASRIEQWGEAAFAAEAKKGYLAVQPAVKEGNNRENRI